jgi:uncharacterized protein (DUF4415 family)
MTIKKYTLNELRSGKGKITKQQASVIIAKSKKNKIDAQDDFVGGKIIFRGAIRPGRPKLEKTKKLVAMRLDEDVSNALKKLPKYSTQANNVIRGWLMGVGAL